MDTHWMFAQNLEEQAALNKMTELNVLSRKLKKEVSKKTKLLSKTKKKKKCELQMFKKRDCVMMGE